MTYFSLKFLNSFPQDLLIVFNLECYVGLGVIRTVTDFLQCSIHPGASGLGEIIKLFGRSVIAPALNMMVGHLRSNRGKDACSQFARGPCNF